MRRVLLVALLAIALAARAAGQISPAVDLAAGGALTDAARRIFSEVLVSSLGIGCGEEIAAFVLAERDDSIRCELWPRQGVALTVSFQGFLPPRTVAIVHSHPSGAPRPSAGDVAAARRLQIPIYAVTRTQVWVAGPDGEVKTIIPRAIWASDLRGSPSVCRDVPLLVSR